jgi:ADP-dependent NAD(P)H-hydrate dehydratase / NAD(P)H-hydrate epimerase
VIFNKADLKKLYKPAKDSSGEDNGQITIIGGSKLFHGAPLLCLTVASRIVDMVFFASPEKSVGMIAESLKSKLFSFIWTPIGDIDKYIEKSGAILIGPGLMRYSEGFEDETFRQTKALTENLLAKFSKKNWVIDAGSLQTMDKKFIPKNSILTPNKKEFEILFGEKYSQENGKLFAKKYNCIIVVKGPVSYVFHDNEVVEIVGGNPGLTKGGTGDVESGLTVALLAKNNPVLAACAGSFIVKSAADELEKEVGVYYNADDLAAKIPEVLSSLVS